MLELERNLIKFLETADISDIHNVINMKFSKDYAIFAKFLAEKNRWVDIQELAKTYGGEIITEAFLIACDKNNIDFVKFSEYNYYRYIDLEKGLLRASINGHIDIVKYLLGDTPDTSIVRHYAYNVNEAAYRADTKVLEYLLPKCDNETRLYFASIKNDTESIVAIIQSSTGYFGNCSLDIKKIACQCSYMGYSGAVEFYVKNYRNYAEDMLMAAVYGNQSYCVNAILDNCDISTEKLQEIKNIAEKTNNFSDRVSKERRKCIIGYITDKL